REGRRGPRVCRPVGGGGGCGAGAFPRHRLPRVDVRPRLARRRSGRQFRQKVRQIRLAARRMGIEPGKDPAMPAELPSLKELFLAALAVAPAERGPWLERACAGDAELRRNLERMLAAHDQPQSLLDNLSPTTGAGEEATGAEVESAGTVIGPYKLL